MCDCGPGRWCHLHAPEPGDVPCLTGRPGLVGMFNSGRSDLARNAKVIVRGDATPLPAIGGEPADLATFERLAITRRAAASTLDPMRAALQRSLDRRG